MAEPEAPSSGAATGCGIELPAGTRHYAAVLGSPIAHSLSPLLHNAGYAPCAMTGWYYGRHEVQAAELPVVLTSAIAGTCTTTADTGAHGVHAATAPGSAAASAVRGFSLTMPLKEELVSVAAARGWDVDATAELTGVANTWVNAATGPRILNTDVCGIQGALAEADIRARRVDIVGTGATARSAVVAVCRSGAQTVRVHGRNAAKAETVADLARRLGASASVHGLQDVAPGTAELLISTVPVGVLHPDSWDWPDRFTGRPVHRRHHPATAPRAGSQPPVALARPPAVLDVAYAPGGLDLGLLYRARGGDSVSGTRMLLHQAVDQFREFAAAAGLERPFAGTVLAAMDAALREHNAAPPAQTAQDRPC